ncbi:MAG TPA: prephenate dehydrogenase [Terrimesophilobacter sp.]|uniref:prephenate dehydrogenase n=1 Tax=Terrimesophilobacter sp. TaxID=2906435 RepID=UPI002F9353E7
MNGSRLVGQVRIVGAGLLGASIGLGLRAKGVDTIVHDSSPAALALAVDYGAGRRAADTDNPSLVVVAVPPDVTAQVVAQELAAYPDALVTDVASVKALPLAELRASGADVSRYVGSHPLAGRERGGAISARADLFLGRPWVIATDGSEPAAKIGVIEDLVLDLGAIPVLLSAEEHDRSVALVSHVPQVISTLLAKRLSDGTERALSLTGQGLRDTTRIAASDPSLWIQILSANSAAVVDILRAFRSDLDGVIATLEEPVAPGAKRAIAETLSAGNIGVARLPGKHGQDRRFSQLVVMVDDKPGELARLLTEIGDAGINVEDLRLEHSPGTLVGLAEISVLPEVEPQLVAELEALGWRIAGAWQ